jgi:eukaryotic-like serine/threonine-protein kinase
MGGLADDRWRVLSPYLDQALDLKGEARAAWLGELRSRDPSLADEVQLLLEAKYAIDRDQFLESTIVVASDLGSLAGRTLGAYTLEAPLGQGGMGSVWLARRSDGRFEGKAAVKLLNAALIGRGGEERFRREGSILARLTHPHIARLIDAGVSSAAQPYLILEHVEGERIDRHCDDRGLNIEARIRLFLDVLGAVAHAHANLIVHRDIKPPNVLVTRDGNVKLLDFGIAKLVEREGALAEATVLTQDGGRALTPEYAAPEQVLGEPVTTATDVYSLGVLLYVLLAGQHPAGTDTRSPAKLIKAIVETQPPRMSEAITSADFRVQEERTNNAAKRAAAPHKLRRLLQGDLDNIVAKALKKDARERYGSVIAFADDLKRYLKREPVGARRDSLVYRLQKFVIRNRLAVVLASIALTSLVAAVVGFAWQAREAATQRDLALAQLIRAEGINEFTSFFLGEAIPGGKPVTMRELLARAEELLAKQASDEALAVELFVSIGDVYTVLEETDNSQRVLKRAFEASRQLVDPATRAKAACGWARAKALSGDFAGAQRLIDEALRPLSEEARFSGIVTRCLIDRGNIASISGDTVVTVKAGEQALARLAATPGGFVELRLQALQLLALGNDMEGKTGAAERHFSEATKVLQRLGRERTTTGATLLNNWGHTKISTGDIAGALLLEGKVVDIFESTGAPESVPATAVANYGWLLNRLGRFAEARSAYERAARIARAASDIQTEGTSALGLARACRGLGELTCNQGALDKAAIALGSSFPADHYFLAELAHEQAMLLAKRDPSQARTLLTAALDLHRKSSEKHVSQIDTELALSGVALASGDANAAETLAREALALAEALRGDRPFSSWVGLSQLSLSAVAEAAGDSSTARQLLGAALAQLTPTLGDNHDVTKDAKARLALLH